MDIPTILFIILMSLITGFFVVAVTRDTWDPPKVGKGTPRYSKKDRRPPITPRTGRPMVLRGESVGVYVEEEVKDFQDFLKRVGGNVRTERKRLPIGNTRGRMLTWSYKPFREGNWWEMVRSGIREPDWYCFFGRPCMIPNPASHQPESPLTLVSSEEDILRGVGGDVTVRVFHPNQPTFPKFKTDEHGDKTCKRTTQKVKGEEFVLSAGDVLVIPRGWAYRARLNRECVALFRLPVHSSLTYAKNMIV